MDFAPAKDLDNIIADKNIVYFAPPTTISDDIVIIFLDEATMKGLPYRSPVPRDFLYSLNEKILAAGPKAVGYDIFFKDPTLEPIDNQLAASFENGPVYAVSAGKTDEANKEYEDLPMGLFLMP
ncbi:MAG: CHASE2 domain-containing protein [Deltaproteobacteria bacterium]|nr:CHASE2 domain-containing protein [Deltaproteobacteria bacterium]